MIINITKKLFVELSTEWEQLFGKFNWYGFTLIHIMFENDDFTGGYEFHLTLLGFSFRVRYNTDAFFIKQEEWNKEIKEIDWEKLFSSQYEFDKATKKKTKKVTSKKTKKGASEKSKSK